MTDRNIPNEQQAFPHTLVSKDPFGNQYTKAGFGLTKRELFAIQVMAGLYAASGLPTRSEQDAYTNKDGGHTARLRRAEEAVRAADALLSALDGAAK